VWSDPQILILCDAFKKENLQWHFESICLFVFSLKKINCNRNYVKCQVQRLLILILTWMIQINEKHKYFAHMVFLDFLPSFPHCLQTELQLWSCQSYPGPWTHPIGIRCSSHCVYALFDQIRSDLNTLCSVTKNPTVNIFKASCLFFSLSQIIEQLYYRLRQVPSAKIVDSDSDLTDPN